LTITSLHPFCLSVLDLLIVAPTYDPTSQWCSKLLTALDMNYLTLD